MIFYDWDIKSDRKQFTTDIGANIVYLGLPPVCKRVNHDPALHSGRFLFKFGPVATTTTPAETADDRHASELMCPVK
jgi:hypothetical protein